MLWLFLSFSLSLGGECAGPSLAPQQVSAHVDDAMLAFATLDEDGVYAAYDEAASALPCLQAVLPASDAAAFHRLAGIRAFLQGDDAAAVLAFQAAHRVQPDYALSTKIAPEGGKLRRLFDQARTMPDALMVSFTAASGQVGYVDGQRTGERPANQPAIVQFVDGERAKWTELVPSGGYLPTDKKKAPAPEPVATAPKPDPFDTLDLPDDGASDGFPASGDGFPASGDGFPASGDGFPASGEDGFPPSLSGLEPAPAPRPGPKPKPVDMGGDLDSRPPQRAGKGGARGAMIGLAVGSAVLSGAAIGTSFVARKKFDQDPTRLTYTLTNGGYFGAIGTGALAVGFTIGAIAAPGGK